VLNPTTSVPEPTTLGIVGLMGTLGLSRRRR
jgi:PEP-CTERM motif